MKPIFRLLSCENFAIPSEIAKDQRLNSVYKYVLANFKGKIILKQAADLANMNPSAFSRYFKKVNNKTFSTFLNEIRIGYACKLLLEEQLTVMEICFAAGFNNASNFNRQFKKFMNVSPSEYKATIRKKAPFLNLRFTFLYNQRTPILKIAKIV